MTSSKELISDKVKIELKNAIKTITLDCAATKNSVREEDAIAFRHAIAESFTDGTRVIIVTGANENFCSGANLGASNLANPKDYDVSRYLKESVNPIILGIRNINIPVIAKVRGVAVGLGANFALACDMVFTSPEAVFSQIFTNIALSSDGGGAYFMPRAVGYKKAFEWMTTGAKIKAEEALQYGLINNIIEGDQLDAHVQSLAEQLASGPSVALEMTKSNLREGNSGSLESTLLTEAENQANNFQTDDFIEGVTAFKEKRRPNYKGK